MSLIMTSRSVARIASLLNTRHWNGQMNIAVCLNTPNGAAQPHIIPLLNIEIEPTQLQLRLTYQGTVNSTTLPKTSFEPLLIKICQWVEDCANGELNQEVAA
jgi:hypothetical protein